MACRKAAIFRQGDQFVFRPQRVVRQFTAAEAGVGEKRTDPAFDIHPAIGPGCPGLGRQRVKLFFLAEQMFRHRLQHGGAFNKTHCTKCFTAVFNGVTASGCHIQPFAGHLI